MTALSQALVRLRKQAKMTQQQVADALQIDRSAVAYYETGKTLPKLSNLKRMCDLYGTEYTTLLDAYMNAEDR